MAMKKTAKRKGITINVNFEGVEAGGKAVPDGVYECEVMEITEEESQDGNPYLKWKFRVSSGKYRGGIVYDNTSLQPQALWRLRGLLETLGHEVEDGDMEIDVSDFIGETLTLLPSSEQTPEIVVARIKRKKTKGSSLRELVLSQEF